MASDSVVLTKLRKVAAFLKKVVPSGRWAPIRKAVAAAVATAIVFAGKKAGIDVLPDQAAEIANYLLPLIVLYLTPASR